MQPLEQRTARSISVDIIRVIAMLMVVALHTVLNFTLRTDFFATKLWFLLEPFIALSKTSVLLFFMLSGYLVINKNRSIHENWQKIKKRLLIPILFFSFLNIAHLFYVYKLRGGVLIWDFVQSQLVRITNFPTSSLWFLGVLVFMYLLNPVWQLIFAKDKEPKLAIYVTSLALMFSAAAQIVQFPGLKNGTFFSSFTGWLGYVFFYFYGGLVHNEWINYQRKKINIFFVVFGLLLTILGDYYTLFTEVHKIPFIWAGYTNYLSIPVILMAIGLFNIIISSNFDWLHKDAIGQRIKTGIEWLAGLSFGIYLTHGFVNTFFNDVINFDFDYLGINVYLYNVLNYTLILGLSIIITYIIKKIPKVKAIIGE